MTRKTTTPPGGARTVEQPLTAYVAQLTGRLYPVSDIHLRVMGGRDLGPHPDHLAISSGGGGGGHAGSIATMMAGSAAGWYPIAARRLLVVEPLRDTVGPAFALTNNTTWAPSQDWAGATTY